MDLTEAFTFAKDRRQGVLVTIGATGRPQISNIMFVPGPDAGTIRISVTDDRAKTRNLRRDPRASLYVLGDNFWTWVVLEGEASLMPVAADPGDATVDALVEYYKIGSGEHPDWDEYRAAMVTDRRLMITLRPERAYGMGI
jgi:PPOX class probable F420-dependent enzyme